MKRVLMTVALAAAFALAACTTAFASHHATRAHRGMSAHVAGNAVCDPSHCPAGSCPFGATAKVTGSTTTLKNGAACSSSASCPTSCPRQTAGAVAASVAKH
jgi:hypothetical protein